MGRHRGYVPSLDHVGPRLPVGEAFKHLEATAGDPQNEARMVYACQRGSDLPKVKTISGDWCIRDIGRDTQARKEAGASEFAIGHEAGP